MRLTVVAGIAFGFGLAVSVIRTAAAAEVAQERPSLEELVARLRSPNFAIRNRALAEIGALRLYPKEITPHVIRLLKDPSHHVRSGAANTLGNLQNALPDLGTRFPEAVPELIRLLGDRAPEDQYQLVRRFAVYGLRHLGQASKPALPELLKIAVNKNDDASVRTEAVQALGEIGEASPEVVATLTKLLDDQTRINENYPTIGRTANYSLERLKTGAKSALPVLLKRLRLADEHQRADAAESLGSVGFGSQEVEKALLELLDDRSPIVQKAALSSLEGINETYKFLFLRREESREIRDKERSMIDQIRRDPARKSPLAKILATQVRLTDEDHPRCVRAVRTLFELDAREHTPFLKQRFAGMTKKVTALEFADLRLQLLRTLAAWLPEKEALPFLIAVDSDAGEAPQVRFRAAVLLCERGSDHAVKHMLERHAGDAEKVKPLISIDLLQKSLRDCQLFVSDAEFNTLKAVSGDELKAVQKGIQLAQYLYGRQQRGAIRNLSLSQVRASDAKIDSFRFEMTVPSEGWTFELRKKGDHWLPTNFRMEYIQ